MTDPMQAHRVDSRGILLARRKRRCEGGGQPRFWRSARRRFRNTVSGDMPDYFPWWEEELYK